MWKKNENSLQFNGIPVLTGTADEIAIENDASGLGCFVSAALTGRPRQRFDISLGEIPQAERLMALHMKPDPFWMYPAACTEVRDIPGNTQWLICRLPCNKILMITGLFSDTASFTLVGKKSNTLNLVADTTDVYTTSQGGLAAYMMLVDESEYYQALPRAASMVMDRLGTGRLRKDKREQPFIDSFTWCTWDAFYGKVSQECVIEGLESFKSIGVPPRGLILDDGWQETRVHESGGTRMLSFSANGKFPKGLKGLSDTVKSDYGIETLIVWHAVNGYWGGVDSEAMPKYAIKEVIPRGTRYTDAADLQEWQGFRIGVVPPERVGKFYDDFHSSLKANGIDGVKVDNQNSLLYLADGLGGRVQLFKAFRNAIESSTKKYFDGLLINCMTSATETWLHATTSNLNRTSTDFWPKKPRSHGYHLLTNAQVSAWYGHFIGVDWDMFQSGHEMGAFHAAGRAVSGGPVYVSDKPGQHNVEVLKKLVCSDGSILRALDPGQPTLDCLFHNTSDEDVLLKVFNRNKFGWVIGVFNCRHRPDLENASLRGTYAVLDIPDIAPGRYVIYEHLSKALHIADKAAEFDLQLADGQAEVITICPVVDDVAVIGLLDKYNASGAVQDMETTDSTVCFNLADGGLLGAWMKKAPEQVTVGRNVCDFKWNADNGLLTILIPPGKQSVSIRRAIHE